MCPIPFHKKIADFAVSEFAQCGIKLYFNFACYQILHVIKLISVKLFEMVGAVNLL